MGLRLALGSTPRQAQALLLRAVAWPVIIAVAAGAAIVLAGISHIQPLLSGISYTDPLAPTAAVSIIGALTIAASWRSVRMLVRQEPIETLRTM